MTHPSEHRAYFFKIDTTIKKIRNVLQQHLNQAGFDLTVDQWVLIDHVARNEGVSQNELAEMTAKDAPTITRILELLVKKNLIDRKIDSIDRRRFNLYLTNEGQILFEKALPIVLEIRRRGWGDLSDTDYENFVRIMDSIYQNFSD
jgi:DNA-binding MarR family transcriptional regulator